MTASAVEVESMLRYFLPTYLLLYFALAFFWRSFVVWKRTGNNPYMLGRTDNAHDYIGFLMRLCFGVIALMIVVYAFFDSLYQYLTPIVWLERNSLKAVGVVLLIISFAWTVFAQIQMGDSWRIGIDQQRTSLVQSGVFRYSRNPIFLGMIVTLLGLFLTLPNAMTLLTFALGFALIQIQVRLEEDFLTKMHESKYADYCRKVRRWL